MNTTQRHRPASRTPSAIASLVFGACIALSTPLATAAVYKCQDASGGVMFTDKACPDQVAGAVIDIPTTNVDSGYDRQAQQKVSTRAKQQSRAFRNKWQAHNAKVEREEDKPEIRRNNQYNQLRDGVPKPTSARKAKNRYGVKNGY